MGCAILFSSFLVVSTAGAVSRIPGRCQTVPASRLCAIHFHHRRTEHLRVRMGEPWQRYRYVAERYPTRRDWLVTYWARRHRAAVRAWRAYRSAPWLHGSWHRDALCVHHYEGAWNDPGAPYYGGMQMDLGFQQAYGREWLARYGTADHWPVADQLHAAYRAWRVRSWTPWPNTAAACGLL